MNDDEIIEALRRDAVRLSAVELATLLNDLTDGNLSQGTFVTYFKRAFPNIPLRVLLDASGWTRLTNGDIADAEFNEMLRPWLST